MFYSDDLNTFVIDIGTETFKIGYAGTESPFIYSTTRISSNNYTSPVTQSRITNVDKYISIIEDNVLFKQKNTSNKKTSVIIQTESEEEIVNKPTDELLNNSTNILIAENTFESLDTKQKVLEQIMESKKFSSLIFQKSGVLDLFSTGKTTGIVISLSGGSTQVISVIEGFIGLKKEYKKGGYDITQYYKENIKEKIIPRGYKEEEFNKIENPNKKVFMVDEYYREIKETTLSFDKNFFSYNNKIIEIENNLILNDIYNNLINMIDEIIKETELEYINQLLNNIVICGGSKIKQLVDKINIDLNNKYSNKIRITDEKTFTTFLGGSVIGSLGSFKPLFISYKDYEEYGISILERKKLEDVVYSK